MKIPIYVAAVAVTLLAVAACQPNLPAGTIVAVPAPMPPPPPPMVYQAPMGYQEPPPPPRYNVYVKRPSGKWAQKRCPVGQHWRSSHRVMVKTDGVMVSKVKPARCVPN